MTRFVLSPAAAALLRALFARAGVPRHRILLIEWESIDWQSLTFAGERHEIALSICAPESAAALKRLTEGLATADFDIPGHFVADIAVAGDPKPNADGSIGVRLEALTIAND